LTATEATTGEAAQGTGTLIMLLLLLLLIKLLPQLIKLLLLLIKLSVFVLPDFSETVGDQRRRAVQQCDCLCPLGSSREPRRRHRCHRCHCSGELGRRGVQR
jgi:hypothetical protein